jgi:hypothetical protein
VAERQGVASGGDDPADPAGPHHLAHLDRGQVALGLGQPGAHGGVDADPVDLDQRLTLGQLRQRNTFLQGHIVLREQAHRPAAQHDAAVGDGGEVDGGLDLHARQAI